MSSSSSAKQIQATVTGHKGRLAISKVPAVEMQHSEQIQTTPINPAVVTNQPINAVTFDSSFEFVLMHLDRDAFLKQNFTELFTKRANGKDQSKMSVSAIAEYTRLKKLSVLGAKLLSKLCDFLGLSSVLKVGKQRLNTLENFTSQAPHLITCVVEVLKSLQVSDINEHLLFRSFSATFALKRRVFMRQYKKQHPDEVCNIIIYKRFIIKFLHNKVPCGGRGHRRSVPG